MENKEKSIDLGNMLNYQNACKKYAVYPKEFKTIYPSLGICGEAGEVADKVKKVIRDKGGVFSDEVKAEIVKEIGDVLWYCAILSDDLGFSLEEVAKMNIEKLESRYQRNKLSGSGDNR